MIPPKKLPPLPPASQQNKNKVQFAAISKLKKGQRAVLYGPGGIGKTTLACKSPGKVAFIDSDESLEVLKSQLGEQGIELPVLIPATDWASMLSALQSSGYDSIGTIVLDSITKCEEWSVAWTVANVKHEKGHKVDSIEGYGFGKGLQFNFDTFMKLLAALDRHVREGRNVILIAHECVSNVPNPKGADWIRYEPRLQSPSSGKASIRYRVKEWADHVLFLGYDVEVDKDGNKASGHGSKTLYTSELPFCMAKSRTTNQQFDITDDSNPWDDILK